jgi:uncharacterized protein YciI
VTGPHLLLLYDYVEDVLERRGPHREAHLAHIGEWVAAGRMLMAGALGDPPTGAAFVLPGDDPARAERFAEGDPYVAAGLVTRRRVVPWTVVAAAGAQAE